MTRTDGRTSERPLSIHKGANRALGGRGGSGCDRDIDEGRARRATPSSLHPSIPVRSGKLNEKERGGGAPVAHARREAARRRVCLKDRESAASATVFSVEV